MNLENLPQFPPDKANHFLYGSIASLVGAAIAVSVGLPVGPSALAYAAAAGTLKELWDKWSGLGDPDIWDAVATAAGGLPAFLVAWMVA